jgi:hypothetical protein
MKIQSGDVFAISTTKGFGFFQHIQKDRFGIELIRVLEVMKEVNEITQAEVDLPERYIIQFVLGAALRRKLVCRTGLYTIPSSFKIPTEAREKHIINGEFLGWFIVDRKSLQRKLKRKLNSSEIKLSPHGIPNDTLIKEWLETDWRLSNWH